jgi:phosphatidylglycerol---prolipoprotein diacylglyceryl transferase
MVAIDPDPSWIAPYGVMLVVGCIAAWWLARRRATAVGLDPSHIDLAIPLALLAGLLAAGALDPGQGQRRAVMVVLAALPVLYGYARAAGLSFRKLADTVALPALALMAAVRVGCFLAGCCFGRPSGGWRPFEFWAVQYPAGSFAHQQHALLGLLAPGAPASLPVHPVQLYEAAMIALLALAIFRLRARRPAPGAELLAALGGYAALRLMLDFLRADHAVIAGPFTANQLAWLAGLALAGIAGRRLSRSSASP